MEPKLPTGAEKLIQCLEREGVETVLALLRKELETVMKQAGTTSIRKITRDFVVARA